MAAVDTRARGTGRSNSTRCEGAQKRTETEFQIEKIKPLKDPTSHNPKKKDNISLVNVMRHKESCLTVRIERYGGWKTRAIVIVPGAEEDQSWDSARKRKAKETVTGLILHNGQNKWFMICICRSSFVLSFFLAFFSLNNPRRGGGRAERNEGSPT